MDYRHIKNVDMFLFSSNFAFDCYPNIEMWQNVLDGFKEIRERIQDGYNSGRANSKIAQEIAEKYDVPFDEAERLVRTETAYISGQSDLAAYKRSGARWYRFVATLDTRTCDDCGPMDNDIFEVEKAQVGVNYPPMHPNCRCTVSGVVDKDNPNRGTRFARDAQGKGIQVPSNMSYSEWRKWQEAGAPEDIEAWLMEQREPVS